MCRDEGSGENIQEQMHPQTAEPQPSQVAQLRAQIDSELAAMQQGLSGLASGTARHRIIAARLRRVDHLTNQMAGHVGQEAATDSSCQAYMRVFNTDDEKESRHG
ncbi:hypothetical protein EPA93_02695 [Ktedonosporobacter rubrisoli]|uniref:Uncharacterized protein n=1 Tax=Ktedonosporobacter rubrisoli TaxID=2509675 RepID=A0A4P6JK04_KTERU|nr:hypothetical protein [Ktedonosporobacter rubrisoli]QBD74956.1 hypothetical protein EPA93_02695 [Ktedonosporobacter rubrisoli]